MTLPGLPTGAVTTSEGLNEFPRERLPTGLAPPGEIGRVMEIPPWLADKPDDKPENGSDLALLRAGPIAQLTSNRLEYSLESSKLTLWRWTQGTVIMGISWLTRKRGLSLGGSEYNINLREYTIISRATSTEA